MLCCSFQTFPEIDKRFEALMRRPFLRGQVKSITEMTNVNPVSISSTFYAQIFCTKVSSKPNSKQRKAA